MRRKRLSCRIRARSRCASLAFVDTSERGEDQRKIRPAIARQPESRAPLVRERDSTLESPIRARSDRAAPPAADRQERVRKKPAKFPEPSATRPRSLLVKRVGRGRRPIPTTEDDPHLPPTKPPVRHWMCYAPHADTGVFSCAERDSPAFANTFPLFQRFRVSTFRSPPCLLPPAICLQPTPSGIMAAP